MRIIYRQHYYQKGFWYRSLRQWAYIGERLYINVNYFA